MHQKIFFGKTDVGLKRKNNEDAFVVSPERDFCLTADGMGGAAAGEIASKIFADTTQEIFAGNNDRSQKEVLYRIQKAFHAANEKILEHVILNTSHKGMGCTAELLAFSDEGFIVGHIGDSRTYRLREGHFEQLTQDHTIVQQQFEEGLISSDQIKDHPMRNVIFRAVGIKEELALDLIIGKIFAEDMFLLCSDGLTDMIPDEQIREILCSDSDISGKAEELIETAKDAGGTDNITVVLAAII
jgi:serine/threonine protein phosphatase PrpC